MPSRVVTVARAAARAQRRRRASPAPRGRDALERLRARLPAGAVAAAEVVEVSARRPPWTKSGVELRAGDEVTTFAAGRVLLSRPLDVALGAHAPLWFRVGCSGTAFRGTRATHGFAAGDGGTLELAIHPPGRWTDPSGAHADSPVERLLVSGGVSVLVVRWAPGVDSTAVLAGVDDPLAAEELDRRRTHLPPPAGWSYLWHVGDAETHADGDDGTLACRTHADVGILTRPVDVPLTDRTLLRWSWRVDALPSALAEDTLATHDYLSIALEFDNGHDLTWHWSAALAPGHAYRCPIPSWRDRETHLVVRSGTEGLGRWLTEERPVRRDYAAAVGPPPERIVAIWLIAVSVFQRGEGRCAYRDVELREGRG